MKRSAAETKSSRPIILIADQFSELGGSQRTLLDLLSALQQFYVPVVALPGPGPFAEELERCGVRWEPLASDRYTRGAKSPAELLRYALRQPALVARLAQLARATGAALLYANGPRLFPSTAVVARRAGLPLLWHLQVDLPSARDRWLVQAAARLARPAIIACSQACLQPFPPRSVIRRRAEVVYIGVPPLEIPNGWRAPDLTTRPVIGLVGLLHPDKGQDLLLRAAREVLRAFPEARFRLVGRAGDEAYARRLRKQAQALPPGCVEFAGPLPSAAEALAGLDVLAVPSRREALGRVVLEAFSAGIAVVASDAGGIPEVVEPQRNGLLFPCGDAGALARALIQLLGDHSLRAALIRGGRESYQRRWRLERFQQEMLERIARQIGQRRSIPSLPAR